MRGHEPLPEAVVVGLAGAAVAGAWLAAPAPRSLAAVVGLVAVWRRWPLLLVVAVAVGASGQAASAWQAVQPATAHPVDGVVTLLTDPRPIGRSIVVDVRHDGHRYSAWVDAGDHPWVVDRLAGEQLSVAGQAEPRSPDQLWLATRGVVGRIDVDLVRWWRPGSPLSQLANGLRRTLVAGTDSLSEGQRNLVLGFVLGDDRFQSDLVTDDFRGAGLGHLLAVSGQNVAYVLVLAHPLLARLEFRARLPVTLALIGFFALLTRFEPSVLRASAMAGLAAAASAAGYPAAGRRLLALAVTGLVLWRPLLIHSLAFQLSVAASAGILVVAPRVAPLIPGPSALGLAFGVTVGAQLAVSPLLLGSVGDVPVAALPANVMAAPAAGPISGWMLTGGMVAGAVGGPVAAAMHLPTRVLVGWVALVARIASSAPLGQLGWMHLATIAVALVVVVRPPVRGARRVGAVVAVAAALLPAVGLQFPARHMVPADGVEVWRSGGATVVELGPSVRPDEVLAGVRQAGVRRIDLLVVHQPAPGSLVAIEALPQRYPIERIWATRPVGNPRAVVPIAGAAMRFGDLVATAVGRDGRIEVRVMIDGSSASTTGVGSDGAPRARAPPLRHHQPRPGDGNPEPHARFVL